MIHSTFESKNWTSGCFLEKKRTLGALQRRQSYPFDCMVVNDSKWFWLLSMTYAVSEFNVRYLWVSRFPRFFFCGRLSQTRAPFLGLSRQNFFVQYSLLYWLLISAIFALSTLALTFWCDFQVFDARKPVKVLKHFDVNRKLEAKGWEFPFVGQLFQKSKKPISSRKSCNSNGKGAECCHASRDKKMRT